MTNITEEAWLRAHVVERSHHSVNTKLSYLISYKTMFPCVLKGASVLEVGPTFWGVTAYCPNGGKKYIVEPMDLPEEPTNNYLENDVDRVFLFNTLQHVMDPDLIVERMC